VEVVYQWVRHRSTALRDEAYKAAMWILDEIHHSSIKSYKVPSNQSQARVSQISRTMSQRLQVFTTHGGRDAGNNHGPVTMQNDKSDVKVIGLYGVPGSGKSTLLNELKQHLSHERFSFHEGSDVIANATPGGLDAFHRLGIQAQEQSRELAIRHIYEDSRASKRTAIVTGHFMFFREHGMVEDVVCTESDMATYTHIVYLNVPATTLEERCSSDIAKRRKPVSGDLLSKWQQTEIVRLRALCREHNILFAVYGVDRISQHVITSLIRDFDLHNERYNDEEAMSKLDQAVTSRFDLAETILIIDGDKTFTPLDTGVMFWTHAAPTQEDEKESAPLKTLFSGPLGYSYTAFRQAMLLCEEFTGDEMYETICQQVASDTVIHPEFLSLLQLVASLTSVGAILVSCGLRRVWEIVLEKSNLQNTVEIIAGGRIADGLVVTAETKAAIVSHLQNHHQRRVCAFGDSPLDLKMLKIADQAIVVVTNEQTRSKTMEFELSAAIEAENFHAHQLVLQPGAPPRLDITRLPLIDITKVDFVNTLLRGQRHSAALEVSIAANGAGKLLATPMRDAAKFGPDLRAAHKDAGRYLAHEHVSRIIGLEPSPIKHVLGHFASGSRLFQEDQTLIVSLMRGGDPMASGVSKAFPRAMYIHIKEPEEFRHHHLDGRAQVLLVDSVINTGKTVIECVKAISLLNQNIRVVIVAGVIQAQCLHRSSRFYQELSAHGHASVVALRVSETKFTGSGTTDTGNRLFNTTHLP
jgi:uracil phosphoribosyltransferase/phosphoserine phosphatase/adenylate kinase